MLTECDCISKVILVYCLHLYPDMHPLIFREHHTGPTDTLVRRLRPDSPLIQPVSRAILIEGPRMTIRLSTSLRPGKFKHLIRFASVTGRLPERDVAFL